MFLFFKRSLKSAWMVLKRNFWIFLLEVFILVLVLLSFSFFLLFGKISNFLIAQVEAKADISVYFKEDIPEEEILKIKEELLTTEGVDKIEFISREKALEEFSQRHKDNPVMLEALKEIGNPFLASLSIKVKDPNYFEKVLKFFEQKQEILEKIDYFQRKPIIEKIFSFTRSFQKAILGIFFFFVCFAVVVIFVTVQFSLLTFKEEIEIQKLIGASNLTIVFPFFLLAIFLSLLASALSLFFLGLFCSFLSPKISTLFPELSLFAIFKDTLNFLFLSSIFLSLPLGIVSYYLAIRRYLKA